MRKIGYCFLIGILSWHGIYAGFFSIDFYKKQAAQFFVNTYDEKKQLLDVLRGELARLQQNEIAVKNRLDKARAALAKQQYELMQAKPESDITKKKHLLIDDDKKLIDDIGRYYKQAIAATKKNIDVLSVYVDNPLCSDIRIAEKASYSFDEMQTIANQLYSTEQDLKQFQDNKKRAEQAYSQVISAIEQAKQELNQKEKKPQDVADVFNLEINKFKKNIESLEAKKLVLAKELELEQLQEFIALEKIKLFRKDLTRIERTLWVTASDVVREQERFAVVKQEHDGRRNGYLKELEQLNGAHDRLQKEFDRTNALLDQPVKDFKQLSEMIFECSAKPELYRVIYMHSQLNLLDREIALLDAKQVLDDVRLVQDELKLETMKVWVAIAQRRFLHDEADRSKMLVALDAKKAELERQLEDYKRKNTAIIDEMALTTRALSSVQQHIEQCKKVHKITGILEPLYKNVELLQQQLELESELIKNYHGILHVLSETNNGLNLVIQKFSSTQGVLQRSAGAITIEGMKGVLADLKFFTDYVLSIFSRASAVQVLVWTKHVVTNITQLVNLLLALVILLLLYFVGLIALPFVQHVLSQRKQQFGQAFFLNLLLSVVEFVQRYLLGIIIWVTLFYLVRYDVAIEIGIQAKMLFYFISLFYVGYLFNGFKRFYVEHNAQLLQKSFVSRTVTIVYYFMLLSMITYFLSEASITIVYGHSLLTRVLWAVYSLITRALIVVLIMDKSFILALIPDRGLWLVIRERIDRYYVLFLTCAIALIVLSDPFIGYGRLVLAVLQALALTVGLFFVLKFAQELLRHYSSRIFFVTTDETTRERFAHSKTWYVLFVLLGLGALIIGAGVLFARIWGYHASLNTVQHFFDLELARVKGDAVGAVVPITVESILLVVAFVFGGFFLSSLFNRYILQRVYLLLRVDAGVQNTISRISGYIFVLVPFILGLQRVGLGAWSLIIVPLLIVVAWAAKGPADDFFAYFIILVERSVKVGDYIRIEHLRGDIAGVVRKITPRSVVLRRRNSFTIIVPNSKLMRSCVYNWNYSHNYIAFDDIIITVSYEVDPEKVRTVLLDIVAQNALILKSPAPVVRIENFSVNGYEVMLRAFLSTAQVLNQWNIRSDVRFAILKEFKKNNITLAAPIQAIKLEVNRTGEEQ